MKSKAGLLILAFCVLFMAGCSSPTLKEELNKRNLLSEHELTKMESHSTINGIISGGFFLGSGSINGAFGSDMNIQFYWSPSPGEIVVSSLPYSKFRFIIDETKTTPTVEFVFDERLLTESARDLSEKYFPNLNDIVLSSLLKLARVRISKATMEKEVYLPKPK